MTIDTIVHVYCALLLRCCLPRPHNRRRRQ
jgi:hypothetical protein